MVSDYDWQLLDARLKSIEASIQMLEAVFGNPMKYVGGNGDVAYVLQEGSLTNPSEPQIWRNIDETN
jgi:hypothetical protein